MGALRNSSLKQPQVMMHLSRTRSPTFSDLWRQLHSWPLNRGYTEADSGLIFLWKDLRRVWELVSCPWRDFSGSMVCIGLERRFRGQRGIRWGVAALSSPSRRVGWAWYMIFDSNRWLEWKDYWVWRVEVTSAL